MKIFPLLCILLSLSGCALMAPRPTEDEQYVLNVSPPPVVKPLNGSVRVTEPEAAPGLESDRIAVEDAPNHLTHYDGVAWAQPLPQLLQTFLEDALQQSHRFKHVSSDRDNVSADWLLMTDIRDFQVNNQVMPPRVQVRLVITLVKAGNHKPVATVPIEKTITAAANHLPDIVAAFNQAMDAAVVDIIRGIGRKIPS